MKLAFYIVDVFSDKKYAGNQLAVFDNAAGLSDKQMQVIAAEINFAESTFITKIDQENNSAEIRIFTPAKEMQFAGHPIIGTSWVLMNKLFKETSKNIRVSVPIGEIPVYQSDKQLWLTAAQPEFYAVFSKVDFLDFSNLKSNDFDERFKIQEVSTGSAFVIVPVKDKEALEKIQLNKELAEKWLNKNCETSHRAFYFFSLEDKKLSSRMLCIEKNQLIEDAATGSASTCLQAFLLKYHESEIELINKQGEFINRASQIFFKGSLTKEVYDIKIGGQTQFIAQGEWEV